MEFKLQKTMEDGETPWDIWSGGIVGTTNGCSIPAGKLT